MIEKFGSGQDAITEFEKIEIGSYERVYTLGTIRRAATYDLSDKEGFYKIQIGEQLGYRYEVKRIIDKGAFGQVVLCVDMKDPK